MTVITQPLSRQKAVLSPPAAGSVTLHINGEPRTLNIAPWTTLLDALREYAIASRRDPLAFLANETVFGPLSANPRFQEAFARRLKIVQDQGVRAAIDSYLSGR